MTPPEPWSAWKADEPPGDFAERTVALALRERVVRRHARMRHLGLIGVAATLMAGGVAWGFAHGSARPDTVIPSAIPARILVEPSAVNSTTAPLRDLDAGDPLDAAVRTVVSPLGHPRPKGAAPIAADAGPKVVVPPCECIRDKVMCTCF
jgi:hypothetical protein